MTKTEKIALMFASAFSLVAITAPQAASAGTDDYPSRLKDAKQDSISPDDWGFQNRECTSFVAWRMVNTNGFKDFSNYITGKGDKRLSDAKKWGSRASAAGYAVDTTPAKGAVLWFPSGHVAWVESVDTSKGEVTIEDYNNLSNGKYDRRTLNIKSYIERRQGKFIHFKDIKESPLAPKPTPPASAKPKSSPAPSSPDSLASYAGTYKISFDGPVNSVTLDSGGNQYVNDLLVCKYQLGSVTVFDGTTYYPGKSKTYQAPGIVGTYAVGTPSFCGAYIKAAPGVLLGYNGGNPVFRQLDKPMCTDSASAEWKKKCGI
jgi:surface antigen